MVEEKIKEDKKINPVDSIFQFLKKRETDVSLHLWHPKDDLEVQSDLVIDEIPLLNAMMINDQVLITHGLNPIYTKFSVNHMRLKISLDRKSRKEFVDVNKKDKFDDHLNKFASFNTLMNPRK